MNAMNWLVVFPEIVLLAMALLIAIVDLWVTDPARRLTYWLTQATIIVVGAMHVAYLQSGVTSHGFGGMVVSDMLGHLLALSACVAVLLSVAYAQSYLGPRELLKGEFFTLSLLALLGISVMCSAHHLLVVYLGLELMSLSLYALTALRRDHAMSTEAAMKYFVLGALASGFLLYGMSMVYGATGTLGIPEILARVSSGAAQQEVLVLGVVFVMAGLAFKLGAAPFHMWVPDVYQGAPTAVTLMIAAAPKLAAFAIVVRLLVEGLLGMAADWQQMMIVLAVVSLAIGNLAAIAQSNLKRMLAYSTIAQMGFLLLGMSAGVIGGKTDLVAGAYGSSMFYIVTYVLTTLGTFGLILYLARDDFESEQIDDLAGLVHRRPWLAIIMLVFMCSLAGLPPTVGFFAKLAVLQALLATQVTGYLVLAVVAVLFALIGAVYYLRVIKVMFFDAPVGAPLEPRSSGVSVLLALNGAAVLLLGPLSGGLLDLCRQAVTRVLGD
jgi:NADH-quinone oxidoreductase subunit N